MEILIRSAGTEDVDKLEELENQIFLEARSRRQIADAISCESGAKQIIIAEFNGEAVGYAWREYSEIIAVAVAENRRGKGVGAMLLKQLIDGTGEAFLEVRESNKAAIALYHKFGFKSITVRERYYIDGENAVVMKYNS